MRVRDVLAHAARIYRPDDTEWQQNRVETVLRALDVWDRRNDWCGTLSTGLRRRVAIARAVLNAPRLLLLDEVTNGLDIVSRNTFYEWLVQHQLREPTNTVILASHNTAEIAKLCNFFIVLREGQQLFCGPREELVSLQANVEELERVFLALLRS